MLTGSVILARDDAPAGGVSLAAVADRAEWERLYAQVAEPHFTQSWVYGEGKRAEGWSVERLVFHEGQQPVAICQLLSRRLLGVGITRINRGPLFLHAAPAPARAAAVLRALRTRWRFGLRGLLLIAPALPAGDAAEALLREAGFWRRRPNGWGSALIDLTPDTDRIRAGVSSKWRNHLNGSMRAGLELRAGNSAPEIEWMLERHAANMAAKGFVGPGVPLLRAMTAAAPDDFRVFQARLGGEPVCGILVARHGSRAETFISWTGDAGRRSNAHHFLLWHVLLQMKEAGCRSLDLGGYTTSEKYGAYKRGMKGAEYRLSGEWFAF